MDFSTAALRHQPGVHPILIPHVVEKVMEYLSSQISDLRLSRLVCKQWASSASVVLRKQSEIRVGRYCTETSKLVAFLELAQSSDFIPVSKFAFTQDIFQQENEFVLKNFFQVFSQTLESLTLWFDLQSNFRFDQNSFVSSAEFQRLQLPRLKSLGFDDRRFMNQSFEETGPLFIKWLLQASPNLEELIIQYDREFDVDVNEKPGRVNQMLLSLFSQNQGSLRSLKDLKLDVHIDDDLLKCLTDFCKTSRLTSLHLCLRRSSFQKQSLSSLLSILSYSLQELRLTFLSEESSFVIEFPRMESLQLLEVSGWDTHSKNVFFGNFSYPSHLPRLKSLFLSSWTHTADWWQFFCVKSPVLSLEELKLPEKITTVQRMSDVVRIFPNLRKLELHVSNMEVGVLELVFEHLTELRHLKILKSGSCWETWADSMDSVFTGISKENCDMILKSNSLNNNFPVIVDPLSLKQRPGLANLTKLRRLEMKDWQHMVKITDVTGYLAFLNMQSLEYLDAGRSGMSEECMKKLAKRFPQNMAAEAEANSSSISFKDEATDDGDFLEFPARCNYL